MIRFALALMLLPALAAAEEIHDCVVADFLTSDRNDGAFAEMNRQKIFTLTRTGTQIDVAFDAPDGRRIAQTYGVVFEDDMTVFAIRPQLMNLDSLVLPANPERRGPRFNATISLQGEFFVNAWILACTTR